jgi:hypothetical protein
MPSEIGVRNFAEFWPVYLRAHSHPGNRAFHYAATLLAFTSFILTLVTGNGWYLLGGLLASTGLAWSGHRLFQGGHPLVFSRPVWLLWAVGCELRMFTLALTGRLHGELDKYSIASDDP